MCSSFTVCSLLIYISETANISGNGSIHFGGHKNIIGTFLGLAFIILLLNYIIVFLALVFSQFITILIMSA